MDGGTHTANEYHLTTEWWFEGTAEEFYDILSDSDAMRRWWRAILLDLDEAEPGDEQGIGKNVRLHVKSWLPYELRWQFRVREANRPNGFSIEAWGDLNGRGTWTLTQEGPWVHVHYDWRVSADTWYLRYFSFALKPLFAWNHRWAMQRAEEGIRLELARRRATTPAERDAVPLPPLPATKAPAPLIGGVIVVVGLFIFLRRRTKRAGESKQ
jgi:hypothetical protein